MCHILIYWWHQHDVLGVIIMELHGSENELFWQNCNWITMNYTIYTMNHNFTIRTTCSLTLTMYKYYELQVVIVIQKLSCKAGCKRPRFLIVFVMPFSLFLFICEKNNNLQMIRDLGERFHYHQLYSYNVCVDTVDKVSKIFLNDQDIYHIFPSCFRFCL
jgi:hypothetical protein